MRLIVLDTNVIVSAAIKPGSAPAKLVMDWVLEGQVQSVISPWIAEEYREVAQRAKFRRYGFLRNGLNSLSRRVSIFQTQRTGLLLKAQIRKIFHSSQSRIWRELGS
jgi:putative PIN family toxin of toxin-antitoxin system